MTGAADAESAKQAPLTTGGGNSHLASVWRRDPWHIVAMAGCRSASVPGRDVCRPAQSASWFNNSIAPPWMPKRFIGTGFSCWPGRSVGRAVGRKPVRRFRRSMSMRLLSAGCSVLRVVRRCETHHEASPAISALQRATGYGAGSCRGVTSAARPPRLWGNQERNPASLHSRRHLPGRTVRAYPLRDHVPQRATSTLAASSFLDYPNTRGTTMANISQYIDARFARAITVCCFRFSVRAASGVTVGANYIVVALLRR